MNFEYNEKHGCLSLVGAPVKVLIWLDEEQNVESITVGDSEFSDRYEEFTHLHLAIDGEFVSLDRIASEAYLAYESVMDDYKAECAAEADYRATSNFYWNHGRI